MKPLIGLCFTGLILFTSCTSHTYSDVVEEEEVLEDLITFQDVRFVFTTVCQDCHQNPPINGAPMSLVTFEEVKESVENRGLLDRVSREEGASGLMPLGGPRLPQETIDLLVQWNEDGLLEE